MTGIKLHVLGVLEDTGDWLTTAQIAQQTGYSSGYVLRALKELGRDGLVTRTGPPYGAGRWAYRVQPTGGGTR